MIEVSPRMGVGIGVLAGGVFLAGALRSAWFGLAALLGLVALVAILRQPGIGIGLLTFLIPLERMQRITNDDATFTLSLMRLVAVVCLAALLLGRIHQRRSLRVDLSMLFYGVYALFALASIFHSSDPYNTKRAVGTVLANCLFLFLYLNYFQDRRQIHLMIAIWLAANLLGAGYSAYDWSFGSGARGNQKLVDPGQGTLTTTDRWSTVWEDLAEFEAQGGMAVRRSMGPTSHATVYGINLVLTIPFFFYLLRRHRRLWQRAGLLLCLGLISYNILLTNTRAVFLAAVLTGGLCIVFGLFTLRTRHVLAGLLALALLIPAVPQDALTRMLDPRNYRTDTSATLRIRLQYWDAGWRILQQHFLLGIGVGNEKMVPAYVEDSGVPHSTVHNIYLQIALEAGLLGWSCFFAFVGLVFHYARAGARALRDRAGWEDDYYLLVAIEVAMLAVLAFGLQVDVFNFSLKGWWLMAAAATVLYHWARALPSPAESPAAPGAAPFQPLPAQ